MVQSNNIFMVNSMKTSKTSNRKGFFDNMIEDIVLKSCPNSKALANFYKLKKVVQNG